LLRLLENSEEKILVTLNDNFIHVKGADFALTSKLISGKFPNYSKVIPKKGNKFFEVDRDEFKQTLIRVGILSNELFRSARLQLRPGLLRLVTNNPEQEEAIEDLAVNFEGENVDTIFNIGYLLDIVNSIGTQRLRFHLKDSESGAIIEEVGENSSCLYVLMPIKQ
jgi:DNA polymerase III subunit beta